MYHLMGYHTGMVVEPMNNDNKVTDIIDAIVILLDVHTQDVWYETVRDKVARLIEFISYLKNGE